MTATLRRRPKRFRPPRLKEWTIDGWAGMYDSRAKAAERDFDAPLLLNLLPIDPDRGGGLVLRPGMQRLQTPTTVQIPGGLNPQWMGEFTTAGGSLLTVIIAGGEVFSLVGTIITKVLSTAQMAASGIGLSAVDKVWCVEFHKTLVISCGAGFNPFTWDGTTGAGMVKLTNAPADRNGPPTVYYARLAFVKSDGKTMVWSEINQPNLGYEAGGFNNAWELTQTSASELYAILGTNEHLYYFRRDSVGSIQGTMTATFATDGVHDGVTQASGIAVDTVPIWMAGAVWWISSRGSPMVFKPGMPQPLDLGRQMPRRFSTAQGSLSPDKTIYGSIGEERMFGNYGHISADRQNGRVHFEAPHPPGGGRTTLIVDAESLRPVSLFTYPSVNTPSGTGDKYSEILGAIKLFGDVSGYLFAELLQPTTPYTAIGFDEVQNGAGSAITGTVLGPMHGWTPNTEWHFLQLDVLADAQPSNTLTVGYLTSRFHKASLTPADLVLTDAGLANTPYERHSPFGLNTSGRWCRPIISVSGSSTANQLPILHGYTLSGVPVSRTPQVT